MLEIQGKRTNTANESSLERLLLLLPQDYKENIQRINYKMQLVEIIIDLGKRPEARFSDHSEYISLRPVNWEDLQKLTKLINEFGDNNRAGIPKTLHRISCLRNRYGTVIGLTCRIGRMLFGAADPIRDLLENQKPLIMLGKPGLGKTTILREITRILANELHKRVVIIDTSNEIGGGSDTPYHNLGRARRMQIPYTHLQYKLMVEAVQNHTPEIIVIDEIGTEQDALAAQTIAERGVQLIGTAHGTKIKSFIQNPILNPLIGDLQSVIISDEEAKRRKIKKNLLERQKGTVFKMAIELNSLTHWTIYENFELTIDSILENLQFTLQARKYLNSKYLRIYYKQYNKNEKYKFLLYFKNKNLFEAYISKNINYHIVCKMILNIDKKQNLLKKKTGNIILNI